MASGAAISVDSASGLAGTWYGGGAAVSIDGAGGAAGSWYGGGAAGSIDAASGVAVAWYGSGSAASVDSAAGAGGSWRGGGAASSINAASGAGFVSMPYAPATWITLWSEDGTTISIPLASLGLSAAQADGTTGDIRAVLMALMDTIGTDAALTGFSSTKTSTTYRGKLLVEYRMSFNTVISGVTLVSP